MSTKPTIYDSLRDRLVNGEFTQGQRLRANVLRLDYDISASNMREILFRLSTVGLVDFQEQRGFRLPRQSPEIQHDLTKFRILLESEGACLSIRSADIDWEARLTAANHKLSHIESRVRGGGANQALITLWTEAERAFHQTLIDACGSETLKQTHDMIYQRFRQQLITTDRQFVFIPENIEQHQAILDAVLAGDEALTRTRIAEHLARNLIR